jgi:Glycosyltransferase 61
MGQYRKLYKSEFIAGYLQLLQSTIGLQVKRRYKKGAPYPATLTVRPKDTGKWHTDIAITDYALVDPQRQLRTLLLSQLTDYTAIQTSCPVKDHKGDPKFPRIAILNRHMTSGRHVLNARAIASAIQANFPKLNVPIVYFENKTFIDQVRFFAAETDIVIAPHGAQLTGMAFLPPCAAVLELFPPNYLVPDFFGSLAAALNISHSFFYLGDNLDDHNVILPHEKYHFYLPNDPNKDAAQCPSVSKIADAVKRLVQNWHDCCSASSSFSATATTVSRSETEAITEADSNMAPPPKWVVDIVAVSLQETSTEVTDQTTMHSLHAAALGANPLVRQYYFMSASNDTADESTCRSDRATKQTSWLAYCQSGTSRRDRASISRMIRSDLSKSVFANGVATPAAWCTQQRFLSGWYSVLQQYRNRGDDRLPDALILMPENTYLGKNLEELLVQQSSAGQHNEQDPQVLSSCTETLRPADLHLVYPTATSVTVFHQAAIERLLQPIHCNNRGGPAVEYQHDAFQKWTCWRLWKNHLGERSFFHNGMSVSDLLFEYSTKVLSSTSIKKWHHIGYCMPIHHLLGYFISFYHVTVPDWILNAMREPNDRLRREFGVQKWKGVECDHDDSSAAKCESSESQICHGVTSLEQMQRLYARQ